MAVSSDCHREKEALPCFCDSVSKITQLMAFGEECLPINSDRKVMGQSH